MRPLGQLFRLMYISWVLVRHGMDDLILASHLFRPVRWVRYILPWIWLPRRKPTRGVAIRRALEDLGPIFVKFGQIISTRMDLLPDDIAIELAKLQDQVPPFPDELAQHIIEQTYGKPLSEIFKHFEATPFASASIAQVHGATLPDGKEVVVKVVRPDILPVIKRDISLLYFIAGNLERYWSDGKRMRPVEVVFEFEKTILGELDLTREAANASLLRRNFINSPLIYVPDIYWDYVRKDVLVMERISGIPVNNIDELKAAGVNLKTLSENGVEIFFTQVFRDNFFHADMHPGNIFVSNQGKYLAVDFGIMGSLTASDQRYLAENFLAFFNRDYRRVAELHIDSGWVASDTRVNEFEAAIRTVCEPMFERPLKEISFGQVLVRLFTVARSFNVEIQPQLVLLEKTLLNIEGLGRRLNPDLDLWTTAKPYLEKWMAKQIGPRSLLRHLKDNAPLWAEQLPKLPGLIYQVLEKAKEGNFEVVLKEEQMQELRDEMRRNNRRLFGAVTGSGLIVSASVIAALDGYSKAMFGPLPAISWILGSFGLAILFAAWPRR